MHDVDKILCPNGSVVRLVYDEDPPDPRKEYDNLGTMAAFHRRYNLGDEGHGINADSFDGWDEMREHIEKELGALIVLPLYLFDHSGLHISTKDFADPWDSGRVGFIFVTREKLEQEYSTKRITRKILETARKVLEGEVQTYDDFLSGQVYGLVHEDSNGGRIDSMYGIYGLEYAREEAQAWCRARSRGRKQSWNPRRGGG